jgi:glycosyltransferase involved in cell wall biosynthesis
MSADRSRENGGSGHNGDGSNGSDPARAVVTIVSGNYLAQARVLCRSLKEQEPRLRRFVVIVDKPVASIVGKDEPFEVIRVEDLPIPDFEDFMAQYTVMEANTAVKPYALLHILERFGINRLVYLDPDILVTAPLDEVWSALENSNIVLTPHLRDTFRDSEQPSELGILRSGAYNLGFIGVRRGEGTHRLLSWWAEKTEHDCVEDVHNGLFVDQKWMDLAPGYIDDVTVLRDAGYNVAYWNLHERELTETSGAFFVDGQPLVFFHFSGYDPERPAILSKHQSRHDLRSMPAVRRLVDVYAARLRREGHSTASARRYGFATLANGVVVAPAIRAAVRQFRKAGVRYPSVKDADAFCCFMMTPNAAVCGAEVSPFTRQVLDRRPDVATAFPRAKHDARDPGFFQWLATSGHECDSELLYARFKAKLKRINPFERIFELYESRDDVRAAFPEAFQTRQGLDDFADWLHRHGIVEADIDRADVDAFVHAGRTGFEAVLEYYLTTPDLQAQFPLGLLPCGTDFVEWLVQHGTRLANLTVSDIRWFQHRIREMDPGELALLTALRNEWVRLRFPLGATMFGWRELCTWLRGMATSRGQEPPNFPAESPRHVPVLSQLEMLHIGTQALLHQRPMSSRERLRAFVEPAVRSTSWSLNYGAQVRIAEAVNTYVPERGVNVAGYFHYAAGMGTSARSLIQSISHAKIPHHEVTLPVGPGSMSTYDPDPTRIPSRFWTQHRVDFDVNITVANADSMRAARVFLGPDYERGRKHIGYWVWETNCLPGRYAGGAEGLDSVWTPSKFSAEGIQKTLGPSVRVHVLPHSVSRPPLGDPRTLPFSLPEGRTLIGFFFDARSIVERKNPAALLRAFRLAFRPSDRVTLVLKVSHGDSAPSEMRKLEALAEGLPVIWLRDVRLDPGQTGALLNRLDIYASLHRSEGFGLVLAEAMALGKPVVATAYSGNLDFMDDSCACLVSGPEVATDRAYGPYPRGTHWADPDVEQAAELLRSLTRDRGLRNDIGQRAKRRIEQTLSPSVLAATVQRLLDWDGESSTSAAGHQIADAALARVIAASASGPGRS